MAISIRCWAEALIAIRPCSASGRESTTSRSVSAPTTGATVPLQGVRERLRRAAGAAVAVADRDDVPDPRGADGLGEVDRRDRHGRPGPFEQALGGVADRDVSLGCVGVAAEHDHLRVLRGGEGVEALRGRAVGHDVPGCVGVAEQLGAALEQVLGLGLGERLTVAVGLGGVAHVGEADLGAGLPEEAAERDRVVLVRGAVIGDDDFQGHFLVPLVT